MNDRPQTIKRATIGIALLVLLSKGVGFVREMVIAYRFGTGIEYDIYLIAVSIPIALYSLFGYAFSNLFIPDYGYALAADDRSGRLKILWRNTNVSLLATLMAMGIIIAAAPAVIRLIAPGLDDAHLPEAVLITRISSVIMLLAVVEAFFRSALNVEKRFLIPAAGPVVANVVLIGSILLFSGQISTRAILYGLVFGYLAQVMFVYLPFRKTAVRRFFIFRFFHRHTGVFFLTAVIILIIESASQVYAVVDRYFASSMEPGIVSALGYAYLLIMLPVAIFAYALSTAVFPYLTDAFARKDSAATGHLLTRAISVSLLFALPATMLTWVFADKLVMVLFRRGAFDMTSVAYTSSLLKYFALSLTGQFLLWILSRAYYAAKKYRLLIVNVVVVVAVKIGAAVWAVNTWGYIGLAISSTLSYSVGAILLAVFAGRSLAPVDWRTVLQYVIKLVIAAVPGYAAALAGSRWIVGGGNDFGELIITLPAGMALSLVITTGIAWAINIPDVREAAKTILHRNRRGADPD